MNQEANHSMSSYQNESNEGDLPEGVTETNMDINFGRLGKQFESRM